MAASLSAAREFVYGTARLVDRRVFEARFEGGSPERVVAAVEAYRNADGGFGNALEPDKRVPASQPMDVAIGLELIALAGGDGGAVATATCGFLASVADDRGAVPLALRSVLDFAHAEHFDGDWAYRPGLWATAWIAGWLHAFRVEDPWLERADAFCFAELDGEPDLDAHGIRDTLRFLRHVPDTARAAPLRARLLERLPRADYFLADPESAAYGVSPLEFDDPVVEEDVLVRHVDRLEEAQQPDGGWPITWTPPSETAVLEWRGHRTVVALATLRQHGRL